MASPNQCHSVASDQQQQQRHNNGTKQLRIASSWRSKSRKSGGQRVAAVSPSRLSSGERNALLCWCCIRRSDKAVPSPPPSSAALGSPVMTMPSTQNGAKTSTASPPMELSALKLNGLTERQQKKKKARSSTFSASSASRCIFPRLHRSLSSQQQHKLFRTNTTTTHALPPLDLRALDAADGTPNNTRDYLEVGRAEGGWIRDENFWRRQQEFYQLQHQQQPTDTVDDDSTTGAGNADGGTVEGEEQPQRQGREEEEQQQQHNHHNSQDQLDEMETARTSRTEDILHYPSMDTLIDEILMMDGDERKMDGDTDDFKQYFDRSQSDRTREGSDDGCELEAVVPCHPSPIPSATSGSSPTRHFPSSAAVPPFPRPADAPKQSTFVPSVFFTAAASEMFMPQRDVYGCGTSSADGGGAVTARQTALVVPARHRPPLGALPALTQSLFDVITVTYIWIASSLALIVQWFM